MKYCRDQLISDRLGSNRPKKQLPICDLKGEGMAGGFESLPAGQFCYNARSETENPLRVAREWGYISEQICRLVD